uniref:Major facilitator superfamily (MFS) profile domain-containing protein n=1 Tax=Clastoptera arizonana TaxID=38151 RepID=A0A1B6CDW6_9HEMI
MRIKLMPTSPYSKGKARQYITTFIASLSFLTVGQSVAWPSPTIVKIMAYETPIYLDLSQISWMVSLMFFGNLMSPIPAGYLMEKFGRKKCIIYVTTLQFSSWILILIGQSVSSLYIARFLSGLFFGLISTVEPIYIGEIAQSDIRGRLSTFNNLMMSIGMLLTFVIGPYISYYSLAIVSLLLTFLFFIMFLFMPESPYFLVKKDKNEMARKSLSWLRGDKNKIELDMELNMIEKTVQEQLENQSSYQEIFVSKGSRKAFVISEIFAALKRLSGNGVIQTFAPTTLPHLTFNFLNSSQCVIIFGIIGVISCLCTVLIADKYGRKILLSISCFGCAVTTLISAFWFYIETKTDIAIEFLNGIPFIMFSIHTASYSLGLGSAGGTIKGELFPANVKSKMSALTTITLAVTSFILNKFYLIIAYEEGVYLNYVIFSISCFAGLIFTITYLPETKGKSLQEIQDILNGIERQKITTPVLSRIV